jgi:NADH:ubiquinone reductase (H+-translocating)
MEAVDPKTLDPHHAKRVVIVGGGYAGMTCAVTLAHRMRASDGIEIVLVDPRPYQQALSELDLVAAGTARPQFAELWHADVFRGLPIKVVYDRLDCVWPDDHRIEIGPRGTPRCEITYWRLVLATGATPHVPAVPGLGEHALTMWSVADALLLQRRIEHQFALAATADDPAVRRAALAFTVVGGGATGVEIIGTMAKRLPKMLRHAGLDPAELTLTLIEGRPDILYDLPEAQRARARRHLGELRVDVELGHNLERVENGIAYLAGGGQVCSPVLVWCGGAHADRDAVSWGLHADNGGRLVAEQTLKARDQDAIYVIGDVASFIDPKDNRVLPMLAQFAIREAEHSADAVLREARGQELRPFAPHMHGEFVSVGPGWGIGWMFRLPISGWPAIVMKRLTYIMYWVQVGSYRLAWKRTRQMIRMRR